MKQEYSAIMRTAFIVVAVIVVISVWSAGSYYIIKSGIDYLNTDKTTNTSNIDVDKIVQDILDDCNVYGINLHGSIVTSYSRGSYNESGELMVDEISSDDVSAIIKKAEEDDEIKYVLAEINSSGGSPAAGMEMMTAFKNSKKPVIALIRDAGLSSAYWAATGAQTIFASAVSDVGSIGVTASYLENVDKNKKEGLNYVDLSVGKYKDTFNPNRALSDDEKKLIMRDINLIHEYFIKSVATNRNLDVSKVRKLADGSTMMGEAALKNGLIDKIGNIYDVRKYLAEQLKEEINICWQN